MNPVRNYAEKNFSENFFLNKQYHTLHNNFHNSQSEGAVVEKISNGVKVVMISLDSSILDLQSEAAARMKSYGTICDELHIVILGNRKAEALRLRPSALRQARGSEPRRTAVSSGQSNCSVREKLSPNVFVYSTNSAAKFLSPFGAYRIGKKILSDFGVAPKIITAQDPFETGLVGWLLAKKFKIGLEVQMHGDFYGNDYWRRERFINRFRHYLGKFVLRRANAIRVVSERIKKSIADITGVKINKIPVFSEFMSGNADLNFLKNRFPGAYPVILAVGSLVPVKNHKLLIEVFKEVKKELPGAKLIIVGDGPLAKDLRFKISDLRLEDSVELAGHQNNLMDYYASADIFVHPSLYEGWGRVVIEAAHFGLPIVMTDVGLACEVIINNESGLVVPVNDKKALKNAILKLANDNDLRKKLGEGAAKKARGLLTKEQFLAGIKEGRADAARHA